MGQGSGGALTGELYAGASAGSPLLQNGDGTYTPGVSQHGTGGSAYFAADALGSTRGITGGTGAATDALLDDAFGETLTRSGSTATPVQFAGTSGYQADATTGLLLLGHRYYDASIGRFLSSDPAQAGSNWYAYCDDNPLVRVDPTGCHWRKYVKIGFWTGIGLWVAKKVGHAIDKTLPKILRQGKQAIGSVVRHSKRVVRRLLKPVRDWWQQVNNPSDSTDPLNPENPINPENPESPLNPINWPPP